MIKKLTKKHIFQDILFLITSIAIAVMWHYGYESYVVALLFWCLLTVTHRQALRYGY